MFAGGKKRVVVTGIGAVSCVGEGKDALWDGLVSSPPRTFESEFRECNSFDPSPYFDAKAVRRADRFTQFAVAAAQQCFDDAQSPEFDPERVGVFMATGIGGIGTIEENVGVLLSRGERRVTPFLVPMIMANAATGNISMRFGWQGPSEATITACASSTHAIGNAARVIASGRCVAMMTGGTEASLTPVSIAGFRNMTALSNCGISRPFDAERDGFVMAEGAGALLLEEYEHAKARGAHIYAEILGASNTADAHHITAPEPSGRGALSCMKFALEDAGMEPEDIAHINAHGTSTPLNDAAEAKAVASLFGPSSPPTTSVKGVLGHALGAAGALEAIASCLTIQHRLIPPTANTVHLDPAIDIDVVLQEARPWEPGPILSNSFGFGGHNGSLILAPIG